MIPQNILPLPQGNKKLLVTHEFFNFSPQRKDSHVPRQHPPPLAVHLPGHSDAQHTAPL